MKNERSKGGFPIIETSLEKLAAAVYETALKEYGDEDIARTIATQLLLSKMRRKPLSRNKGASQPH